MRLLIVEDDRDLGDFMREGLEREGFLVTHLANGKDASAQIRQEPFDAVLLDVMIPGLDGYGVLKNLRSAGYRGAVILVTARGQERDKLEGLNNGADDYIVKPFLLTELVARIRAVLRRTATKPQAEDKPNVLRAGPLSLDLLKRDARKGNKVIALTKKEFDLLECLMRRPGQVLSQSVIGQQVFQNEFSSSTNTIEVHIKNLRSKIDAKGAKSLIRTVRGCGYALDV
ncbi:MAG TPA: response regulator transcription factor [Elusimicrobiota bacterium]|nr:response regulator transcription factor [Elusimicrobiota bacterium]